jgi:hypothetical protein
MSSFGAGLGSVIGSSMGAADLSSGLSAVNGISDNFQAASGPFQSFGQSFLQPAMGAINNLQATAGADPNLNYNTFMNNYQTSPGAQYQIRLADAAQNNSAAAGGKLLSGSNERALSTINQGIGSTYANQAYSNYLQGNQQQFGQLNTALGNMFNAIGVGTTATGQQAGVDTSQMGATSQIAQAQAKNDQAKGTGLGSMFGGLGSLATAF